ncbi:MAG: hydrogenase maturation protease [Deltaproteobacteria bacterium]|nr:hydrogenase maturation protease [Deltaproteobacteria bacterium]
MSHSDNNYLAQSSRLGLYAYSTMSVKRILILGLGNTLVCDDGVGIYASRTASAMLAKQPDIKNKIEIQEAEIGGFTLIDILAGYNIAIIIDAIKLPDSIPGTIVELSSDTLKRSSHLVSGHQIDLPTALTLGAELGYHMPKTVHIIAIQITNDTIFSEQPSHYLKTAIDTAATRAIEFAKKYLKKLM